MTNRRSAAKSTANVHGTASYKNLRVVALGFVIAIVLTLLSALIPLNNDMPYVCDQTAQNSMGDGVETDRGLPLQFTYSNNFPSGCRALAQGSDGTPLHRAFFPALFLLDIIVFLIPVLIIVLAINRRKHKSKTATKE